MANSVHAQPAAQNSCVEENARTMAAVNQLNNATTQNVVLQGRIEMLNQKIKQLETAKAQAEKPAEPAPEPKPEPAPEPPAPAQ